MSVKNYGIYIAYPPMTDLRKEGLGRYLASFIKGAGDLTDVRFTVVCPSWSQQALAELFQSERVPAGSVHINAPRGVPYILRMYEWILKRLKLPRRRRAAGLLRKTRSLAMKLFQISATRIVQVHALPGLIGCLFWIAGALPALVLVGAVGLALALMAAFVASAVKWLARLSVGRRVFAGLVVSPDNAFAMHLFDEMHKTELKRMQAIIVTLSDVKAWYCPVAFWPSFHDIEKPRLICVPDVWPTQFPVGFSIDGARLKTVVDRMADSIYRADHLVTYSDEVKWGTLAGHYGIEPRKISVVRHAPNRMDVFIAIQNTNRQAGDEYCKNLLLSAIRRSGNVEYYSGFLNGGVKYIFYPTQFRHNKNLLTLLRAYVDLLRGRHIQRKLLLTGNPNDDQAVRNFVVENRLENDVLFLHQLSLKELAAAYQMADLVVNSSFAEGGCPFTFTEALSVDTPIVMARIPVTEEVLTNPVLQEVTFFDPYSWRDCADRIEWALCHREELLSVQVSAYAALCRRTWADVVSEHVAILDRISADA
jgi:glycosyltransferase involved in cell wall biosynthesis